jgi:hypothetical protein
VLDEPFSGLDPVAVGVMSAVLREKATDRFEYWLLTVAELEGVLAGSPWRIDTVEHGPDTGPNYAVALARTS